MPGGPRKTGPDGLTNDERKWARYMIEHPGVSGIDAAQAALKWSRKKAAGPVYRWLKHPAVKAYLERAWAELQKRLEADREVSLARGVASKQTVLEWLTARMLSCDPKQLLTMDPNGRLYADPLKIMSLPAGTLKACYYDKFGQLRIELHDGLPAARLLAEYHQIVGSDKNRQQDPLSLAVIDRLTKALPAEKLKEIALEAMSTPREIIDIQ